MSSRNSGASLRARHAWSAVARSRQKHHRMLMVSLLVLASCVTIFGFSLVPQSAKAQTAPRVTVAAIDPSLVAGRGAQLGIVEQEAENATTNGTILPFDTSAYTLSGEASGRQAVQLAPGQYVAFTLTQRANAVTIRYAIPDAPTGGGIDAPLTVSVDHRPYDNSENTHPQTITLTSKYSDLYNLYPFTNDPNADLLHPDWWITECSCVPARHNTAADYHETVQADALLRRAARAAPQHLPGRRCRPPDRACQLKRRLDGHRPRRLPADRWSCAAAQGLGLGHELRRRPARRTRLRAMRSIARFGRRRLLHKTVYIPAGTFQVNRHIIVDNVTIEGAGSWWSIVKGHQVTLSSPAPDGSVHTGVGFYGKYAADGGSHNVHLSNFAIEGDVRERIDTDQVNGIGGALSDSTIDGLYIHHTKVGIWLDGPMNNVTIKNTVIADQIADGINFHQGVTNSRVVNSLIRNTGDDALAMWSQTVDGQPGIEDANNVFDHNTVQNPVLANAIAIYGGRDNTVSNNVVADPVREGSGLHAGSALRLDAVRWLPSVHEQHDRAGWLVRAQLEDRPRRDLALRARRLAHGGHRGDRRQLPAEHLQRDPDRVRLPGEGPLLDHERALQGHPRRRHGHVGAECTFCRNCDLPERRRAQRRCRRHQQLRLLPLHAGGLGVHGDRSRRQRRRRDHRSLARAVGAAEHDHLRRPAAGRPSAATLRLVSG